MSSQFSELVQCKIFCTKVLREILREITSDTTDHSHSFLRIYHLPAKCQILIGWYGIFLYLFNQWRPNDPSPLCGVHWQATLNFRAVISVYSAILTYRHSSPIYGTALLLYAA